MISGGDLRAAAPGGRAGRFAIRIRGFLDGLLEEHAETLIALVPGGIVPPTDDEEEDVDDHGN